MPRSSAIKFRRGAAAVWTALNPTLAAGEPGFETDTGKVKIGDGATAWASLAYIGGGSAASTSTAGIVELATEAEMKLGSSTSLVAPLSELHAAGFARRQWSSMEPQSGTSLRANGAGAAITPTGTLAMVTAAAGLPFHATMTTGGGAGTSSSVSQTNFLVRRGADAAAAWGGFDFTADVCFTDASYNESGASTGSRLHVGVTSDSMANWLGTDYGRTSASSAFFAREHVNGGATDTNWQICTADQTSKTNASTGLAFTASNLYRMRLYLPVGGATLYWWIWDLTAGTSASGSTAATLPLTTTNMAMGMGVYSINATARKAGIVRMHMVNDK